VKHEEIIPRLWFHDSSWKDFRETMQTGDILAILSVETTTVVRQLNAFPSKKKKSVP